MAITAVGDTLGDITAWAGDERSTTHIDLRIAGTRSRMQVASGASPGNLRLVITNTQYAGLLNEDASAVNMGYRGVKL